MKVLTILAGLTALGGGLLGLWPGREPVERFPIKTQPAAETRSSFAPGLGNCMGGEKPKLEVVPVVDAIQRNPSGREALEFHLEFQQLFQEEVNVNYVVTVVDDLGGVVKTTKAPAPLKAAAKASAASPRFVTPNLSDGFYRLSITGVALGKTKTAQADTWAEKFLEVQGGKITEIEPDDWHDRSRARTPIELPSDPPNNLPDAGKRGGQ